MLFELFELIDLRFLCRGGDIIKTSAAERFVQSLIAMLN